MASIKFKFDTKKLEKDLNKVFEQKAREINLKNKVEEEGGKMRILTETEKELLKILILNLENKNSYTCTITYDVLPEYISPQLKDLLLTLKYSGYCASFSQWLGGAQITLTPEGVNYFEKEEDYKKMKSKPSININNLNASNSIITFGDVYDSNFNIDNSYTEISKLIDQYGGDDKEELKNLLEEVKDYVENILESKSVGKNKSLFTRIGNHVKKHQWFYQAVVTFIGNAVIKIMSGQ